MRNGVALIAVTVLLASCTDGDESVAGSSPTTVVPSSPLRLAQPADGETREVASSDRPETAAIPTVTTTTTIFLPGRLEDADVMLVEVGRALRPTDIAFRVGDPSIYVSEKNGRVVGIDPGSGERTIWLDLTNDVSTHSEQGVVGIAFGPADGLLYVSYTDLVGASVLSTFTIVDGVPDRMSEQIILTVPQSQPNHNGGDLAFDKAGLLYWALGDGGGQFDPNGNGQNTDTLLASIIRIRPTPGGVHQYEIPSDNPFLAGGGAPEIWAYGLRNPWRISFDRATGDLWIGDVGQDRVEEIDLMFAGEPGGVNFGWSNREGSESHKGGELLPGMVDPVDEYLHPTGVSVTGGFVYRGEAIAELRGAYVYADFGSEFLTAIVVEDGVVTQRRMLLDGVGGSPSTFGEDPAGELYLALFRGPILRLMPIN